MTTINRCPNPAGCDGELYVRADGVPGEWCPRCGFIFREDGSHVRCPNPSCHGELYARAEGTGAWCPRCGFVFSEDGARSRCPNPAGCEGELYARADEIPDDWCPTCGYRFSRQDGS